MCITMYRPMCVDGWMYVRTYKYVRICLLNFMVDQHVYASMLF